jgi:hypothetical protein
MPWDGGTAFWVMIGADNSTASGSSVRTALYYGPIVSLGTVGASTSHWHIGRYGLVQGHCSHCCGSGQGIVVLPSHLRTEADAVAETSWSLAQEASD